MALKQLCYIVLPLVVLLLVLLADKWLPLDGSSAFVAEPDHVISVDCDIGHNACPIRLGDIKMTLSLTPDGLPALIPLRLAVSDSSIAVQEAESWLVWFEGRDMEMGVHQLLPEPSGLPVSKDASRSNNAVVFSGIIPICSVDSAMTWLLNVQFVWRAKLYRFMLPASARTH